MNAALAQTYDSTATVYRNVDYKDGNLTKQRREAVLTDVPCRRSSKAGLSALFATTDAAKITRSEKLFTSPKWDIKSGDELFVQGPINAEPVRDADRYFAGETQVYGTHQEIKLEMPGRA